MPADSIEFLSSIEIMTPCTPGPAVAWSPWRDPDECCAGSAETCHTKIIANGNTAQCPVSTRLMHLWSVITGSQNYTNEQLSYPFIILNSICMQAPTSDWTGGNSIKLILRCKYKKVPTL